MRKIHVIFVLCLFLVSSKLSYAQNVTTADLQGARQEFTQLVNSLRVEVNDLRQTVQNQNKVIESQASKLISLEKGNLSTAEPYQPSQAQITPIALGGISQGFNPEIGLIGVVQAKAVEPTTEDGEGNDTIALKELELNLGANVDPYSRLDAIITFNDDIEDDTVEIEEAYYSHWGLPYGFTGRVGKFRSKVGKQNRLHLDQLDTVDYPLVIQDFFGEEGLAASGIRLENLFDLGAPITITGEVLRGNNGDSFSGISRRPIFNTRISTFFELGDSLEMTLGANWMVGDENVSGLAKGDDRFGVHIFGKDFTLEWFLEEGRKIKLQNEFFYQDRSEMVVANDNPWGFYSLLDFRLSPKWATGIRFDYLKPRELSDIDKETWALSPYLTLHQSEFANFSLQFTHRENADPAEEAENAVILEATFLIGKHSHPVA